MRFSALFARTCVCAPPRTEGAEGFGEPRAPFAAAVFANKESLHRTVPGNVTLRSLRLYASSDVPLCVGDGLWTQAEASGDPPYVILSVRRFPRYVLAEAEGRQP